MAHSSQAIFQVKLRQDNILEITNKYLKEFLLRFKADKGEVTILKALDFDGKPFEPKMEISYDLERLECSFFVVGKGKDGKQICFELTVPEMELFYEI